jgi:hypothetical protein
MRIIGIELKLHAYLPTLTVLTEVAVIPCDIEISCDAPQGRFEMYGTLHTDKGDTDIPFFQIRHPGKKLPGPVTIKQRTHAERLQEVSCEVPTRP